MTNLLINRPGTVDEDIQVWLFNQKQKIVQFLAQVVAEYRDSNGYEHIDSLFIAHCLLGVMVSLMADRLFGRNDTDATKIADKILEMLFYGIQRSAVQV